MFFAGLFGSYIYIYNSYLIFRIGCEWPPTSLFRNGSYRNYLQLNAFLLVCIRHVGRTCSCMLYLQVQVSLATHLYYCSFNLQVVLFLGVQVYVIYSCSFLVWMYSIYGSLFFFHYCVFMVFTFVIGLIFYFSSILFVLLMVLLLVIIYLGFDSFYLVLAISLILFG